MHELFIEFLCNPTIIDFAFTCLHVYNSATAVVYFSVASSPILKLIFVVDYTIHVIVL